MITTDLVMRRIKEISDPALALVESTYTATFPVEERRDFALVGRLLAQEERFNLCVLLSHEERYVGFISFWQFCNFVYIEHFAVSESLRNEGWGGKALKQFTGRQTHPVILEAEPPGGDLWSRRRFAFYERQGFVAYPDPYLQPPYRAGDPWIPLCLMKYSRPGPAEPSFGRARQTIYRSVYRLTSETARLPELPPRGAEREGSV